MSRPLPKGPRFVQYFGPTLEALRGLGNAATPAEVVQRIADDMKIANEIVEAVTKTGQSRFEKDVHFARFYLTKDGLIDGGERGLWKLTDAGRKAKLSQPEALVLFNRIHAQFVRADNPSGTSEAKEDQELLPIVEETTFGYRTKLASMIKGMSPKGFEHFSGLLLRKVGFTEVHVTGRNSDGGVDGYGNLQTNPLVTQRVLFQCKKYTTGAVPKDDIMKFQAAVMRDRADRGIFITSSVFTRGAKEEGSSGACAIELVDIERLMDLMEKFEIGVKPVQSFEIEDGFFSQYQENPDS
jgi:restriction system protein